MSKCMECGKYLYTVHHTPYTMCKLSIIVPVYNVEPYLRKCVDSLLSQDIIDYEIILVDDGSTDGSGFICDEYGQMYDVSMYDVCGKCIRVIHQKNGGLSAARNKGICAAKGEYLMFVDSDDYIEPNVLKCLIEQVETEELDVLKFDYQNVNAQYEVFEPNKSPRKVDTGNEVVDGESYLNTRMGYACYAWQFILRSDLIYTLHHTPYTVNNTLFSHGIHFEDVEWLSRMMMKAKRVNSTTKVVYNYLVRQGSITKTQGDKTKIRKNVEDQMTVIEKYSKLISQYPQCSWLRRMQSSMVSGVLTTAAREFYSEREEYINRLRELNVFPLMIADQGRTYVRRACVINMLGPRAFCLIMHLR